ncbi:MULTISPECIES: YdhK family protein [Enteractinococcus]|jgi:hypothetical protein|uniref:Uncharacterized protein DUF1541 n=2 Tax=Enteractinococcus TaxID=1164863 RepID=A0A543AP87_9MICC|nr:MULTISPECIES: YdhK family protein [Enteractinococcus]OAV62450.1 hypothetical protein A6F49_07020 [Enteractinococcus helveticum]TQL74365.1 uncharacterized protein DUF1541 [Enteractinococcus coprophilus]
MKRTTVATRISAVAAVGALFLAGCATDTEQDATEDQPTATQTEEHAHNPDGGPAPEDLAEAEDPTYPVGTTVELTADHMPGMQGSAATISGAFDTATYSVTYTPTDGSEPVVDHTWVIHEELADPGTPPLAEGTEVVLAADHMEAMDGADATIEASTQETVYMVDATIDGTELTNHKWVVESELQPAE